MTKNIHYRKNNKITIKEKYIRMKKIILYAFAGIVLFAACNKKSEHNHDAHSDHGHAHEGHHHDAVKLLFTEYTDDYELFVEADPFVKGHTTQVLAHFTSIKDFKPLSNASVTLSLINGKNVLSKTLNKPNKPGIYKFSISPKVNGATQMVFEIKEAKSTKKISINNVSVYGDEHTAIHIAEKKQPKKVVGAINFTKEQSWKIDFATVFPKKQELGQVIKSTAQVLPGQTSELIVTAKTNGVVRYNKHLLEGQKVNKGDILLSISGNGLVDDNAELRYAEAKANFELAKSVYDRKLALSKEQIVSEKEVETAKTEYAKAEAIFNNLKKNFTKNGQVVISPYSGNIKHVLVNNGQYIQVGTPILCVANSNNFIVKAEIQQKYYPYLTQIYSANIKSLIDNKIYTLDQLNGKIISYGKYIDEDEGYLLPVNFMIEANDAFLPGSFNDIYIKTKSKNKLTTIPNTALIEEQGNYFVFVQITPEMFEKREVKIGISDGIDTEIISGLNSNSRVVSKGAVIVKLAAVSNTLDPHAGHVH